AEQEGQQTETEATGAPQKHHYTLNQQVGSITMIPAAIVVMWRMAQIVAPQLTHSPKPESLSDREKRNDADH
ncbi:DUF1418 family protein, partial [Klebsiella pneumoniae]|uniref:DUF1418 family protein n=1 Tax=Klebsiella pneumoniae TaxID=573 RepID=UPI000E354D11